MTWKLNELESLIATTLLAEEEKTKRAKLSKDLGPYKDKWYKLKVMASTAAIIKLSGSKPIMLEPKKREKKFIDWLKYLHRYYDEAMFDPEYDNYQAGWNFIDKVKANYFKDYKFEKYDESKNPILPRWKFGEGFTKLKSKLRDHLKNVWYKLIDKSIKDLDERKRASYEAYMASRSKWPLNNKGIKWTSYWNDGKVPSLNIATAWPFGSQAKPAGSNITGLVVGKWMGRWKDASQHILVYASNGNVGAFGKFRPGHTHWKSFMNKETVRHLWGGGKNDFSPKTFWNHMVDGKITTIEIDKKGNAIAAEKGEKEARKLDARSVGTFEPKDWSNNMLVISNWGKPKMQKQFLGMAAQIGIGISPLGPVYNAAQLGVAFSTGDPGKILGAGMSFIPAIGDKNPNPIKQFLSQKGASNITQKFAAKGADKMIGMIKGHIQKDLEHIDWKKSGNPEDMAKAYLTMMIVIDQIDKNYKNTGRRDAKSNVKDMFSKMKNQMSTSGMKFTGDGKKVTSKDIATDARTSIAGGLSPVASIAAKAASRLKENILKKEELFESLLSLAISRSKS